MPKSTSPISASISTRGSNSSIFSRGIGFAGYCFAEIQFNPEPERFMKYYRTLFDLYTKRYTYPQA